MSSHADHWSAGNYEVGCSKCAAEWAAAYGEAELIAARVGACLMIVDERERPWREAEALGLHSQPDRGEVE